MVLLVLLVLYLALLGWAFGFGVRWAVQRVSGRAHDGPWPADLQVLAGLLFIQCLLAPLSLFVALGTWANGPLIALGLVLLWRFRAERAATRQALKHAFAGLQLWQRVLLGLLLLTVLLAGVEASANYDTGHYHAQALRWLMLAPQVPGLANLAPIYAYNLGTYHVAALVALPEWVGHLVFPVPALLLLLLLYRLTVELGAARGFWRLLWGFALVAALSNFLQFVPALGSDLSVSVSVWFCLALLLSSDLRTRLGGDESIAAFFLLLVPAMVVQKLSAAPLVLLMLWGAWQLRARWRQMGLGVAAAGLLVALPYLTRNVIQTGYPLFPSRALDLFEVDWKLPAERLEQTAAIITGWNRNPEADPRVMAAQSLSAWFPVWWGRQQGLHQALVVLTLITPLAWAYRRWRSGSEWNAAGTAACLAAAATLFCLYWAPNMRFLHPYVSVAAPLGFICWVGGRWQSPIWLDRLLAGVVLAFAALSLLAAVRTAARLDWSARWRVPPAMQIPDYQVVNQCNAPYHKLYSGNIQCWDAPLPCVADLYPDLERRGARLSDGFRVRQQACEQAPKP